jgi:hypothetical protein
VYGTAKVRNSVVRTGVLLVNMETLLQAFIFNNWILFGRDFIRAGRKSYLPTLRRHLLPQSSIYTNGNLLLSAVRTSNLEHIVAEITSTMH